MQVTGKSANLYLYQAFKYKTCYEVSALKPGFKVQRIISVSKDSTAAQPQAVEFLAHMLP